MSTPSNDQELIPQATGSSLMSRLGPVEVGARGIQLRTIDDIFRFAKAIALSKLCPPGFSAEDCFLIIENGLEVGMSPMAALASTYIVNNRATIFGDMPLALVRQSGLLEDYKQEYKGEPFDDNFKCIVTSKRKGTSEPIVTEYSVSDAKIAEVWTKKGSWTTAPKRMLLFRARGFNLRDNFGDVLKGCAIGELDDGEVPTGFDNAKEAKIVAPNFVGEAATPRPSEIVAPPAADIPLPMPEPPKRRGRPPKSPGDAPHISQLTAVLNESGASEPVQEVKTAVSVAEPPQSESESLVDQVKRKLEADRIPILDFLFLMHRNIFLEGDAQDIKLGHLTLSDVQSEGLQTALDQWPEVVANLKGNK